MKKIEENVGKSALPGDPAGIVLRSLNPDQRQAAGADPKRPLLIVAGAGTGKTKTLTSRVAYFFASGLGRDYVCAITFTNKAAREMEHRIGRVGKGHFIGTFHALGAKILRRHGGVLGRTPDFVIYDDHDSFALVKKILKDIGAKKETPALARDYISDRKSSLEELGQPELGRKTNPQLEEVFTRYEETLRASNAFDFDDLLHKTVFILSKREDIRKTYQDWFRHVLVDEYQDVNPIQYELVKMLVGGGASLSVVGDAEQTIYGWRGSDIGIFLRFPDEWKEANMVTLTQNYRSTGNILRAAGGVIAHNEYDTKVKRAVDLWTENPEGDPVVLYEAYDEDSEAEWIVNTIAAAPDIETGILYRTNAQSRALEQALLRRHIPYHVYGGLKFYERREIKDIVAGVRWMMNPQDELSRDRLEKAFPQRTLRALVEAMTDAKEGRENDGWPLTPQKMVELFIFGADYMDLVERTMTNPRERTENIEELLRFAGEFETMAPFLEEVTLLQATDAVGQRAARAAKPADVKVTLMTVHLAKGLEFDRVFVTGVAEGLLPHARSIDTLDQLQEERRLMYVAMTRARKKLYLSFYGIPSRFLGEIPEDVLKFESADGNDPMPLYDEERYITLD